MENPKFIFDKNTFPSKSAIFSFCNDHIIAYCFYDYTIQICSLRKTFIHTIICKTIPTKTKWSNNGILLGFLYGY